MNKTCIKCGETKHIDLFVLNKSCSGGYGNVCRQCNRARITAWEQANPEKVKARQVKYNKTEKRKISYAKHNATEKRKISYAKHNATEKRKLSQDRYNNTEKRKTRQAAYNKLYNYVYKTENAQRKVLWVQANRGRVNATNAAYIKRIKQATPPWADMQAILDVYMEAEYFGMSVDHIVPIRSNLVCGLHTWENLQLLTKSENSKKGNRVWPDMPTDEHKKDNI